MSTLAVVVCMLSTVLLYVSAMAHALAVMAMKLLDLPNAQMSTKVPTTSLILRRVSLQRHICVFAIMHNVQQRSQLSILGHTGC